MNIFELRSALDKISAQLEVLVYDDFYDREVWLPSVIVHNNNGYYFVARPELEPDGINARIRKPENRK